MITHLLPNVKLSLVSIANKSVVTWTLAANIRIHSLSRVLRYPPSRETLLIAPFICVLYLRAKTHLRERNLGMQVKKMYLPCPEDPSLNALASVSLHFPVLSQKRLVTVRESSRTACPVRARAKHLPALVIVPRPVPARAHSAAVKVRGTINGGIRPLPQNEIYIGGGEGGEVRS